MTSHQVGAVVTAVQGNTLVRVAELTNCAGAGQAGVVHSTCVYCRTSMWLKSAPIDCMGPQCWASLVVLELAIFIAAVLLGVAILQHALSCTSCGSQFTYC
jgi:hypothetical protein